MKEIWKDIKGYEGLYQVSNLGRVKSLDRWRPVTEKTLKKGYKPKMTKGTILKPSKLKKGYLQVSLQKNGKKKWKRIHQLVAETFIPNLNNYPIINHKDENKQNNLVSNLEWCDYEYNIRYSMAKKVIQYNLDNNVIKIWDCIIDASNKLKIPTTNISKCCKGIRKSVGGYKWEYYNQNVSNSKGE